MKLILSIIITSLSISIYAQDNYLFAYEKYRKVPDNKIIYSLVDLKNIDEINEKKSIVDSLLDTYLSINDTASYLFLKNEFAFNYYGVGLHKEFIDQLNDIYQEVPESPSTHIERTVNLYFQTYYYSRIDFEKYMELNAQIIKRSNEEVYPYFHMDAYKSLGGMYIRKREFRKAFECFSKAENYALHFNDTVTIGLIYRDIGYEILNLDTRLGMMYLDKSNDILFNNPDIHHEGMYLYYLEAKSRGYKGLQEYEKALSVLKTKNEYIESHKDSLTINLSTIIETYRSLSKVYSKTNDFGEAKKYATRFLDSVYKYVGDKHAYYSMGVRILGEVYLIEGKSDSAIYYFEKALSLVLKPDVNNHKKSNFLYFYTLGEAQLAQKDYYSSRETIKNALACLVSPSYEEDTFYLNYPLVSDIKNKKDYRIALNDYNNSLLGIYYQTKDTLLLRELIKNNKYNLKIQEARYSFSIDEETMLDYSKFAKNDCYFGLTASLLFVNEHNQKNYLDTALYFADQTKLFHYRNLQVQKKFLGNFQDSLFRQLNLIQNRIIVIENQRENINNYNDSIFQLKNKAFLLKMELEKIINNQQTSEQFNPNIIENSKDIEENTAYISYVNIQDSLFIMGVSSDKKTLWQGDNLELKSLVGELRKELKTGGDYSKQAKELFEKLILPVKLILENKRNIVIIQDEFLLKLPFEVLENNHGEKLIDKYSISYQYAFDFKRNNNDSIENKKVFAIAPFSKNDSDLDREYAEMLRNISNIPIAKKDKACLPELPNTKKEVEAISKLCKKNGNISEILIGNNTTKIVFLEKLEKYDIIHIASHGIETNKLYSSGIVFNNNREPVTDLNTLMLYELPDLKIKANLVVLSACATGEGEIVEGEGIMALPRGFIYAGVPNVIASLWKVHDERTRDLMIAFYKHLLEDKLSYAEALRLAKLDCIEKGFLPLDWAGFVLIEG